jgi:hypothetical protein
VCRTPSASDQSVARPLTTHRQHKHRINADIHASIGIQTHDPSVLAGEDSSCLRPHGHCDRHTNLLYIFNMQCDGKICLKSRTSGKFLATFLYNDLSWIIFWNSHESFSRIRTNGVVVSVVLQACLKVIRFESLTNCRLSWQNYMWIFFLKRTWGLCPFIGKTDFFQIPAYSRYIAGIVT